MHNKNSTKAQLNNQGPNSYPESRGSDSLSAQTQPSQVLVFGVFSIFPFGAKTSKVPERFWEHCGCVRSVWQKVS